MEIYAEKFLKKLHIAFTTLTHQESYITVVIMLYFSSGSSIAFIEPPIFNSPYFINIYILFTNPSRCTLVQCWQLRLWTESMIPLQFSIMFFLYLSTYNLSFSSSSLTLRAMSFIYWMFPLVVDEKSDRDLFGDVIAYLFWDDMEDLSGYVMEDSVGENCILFWCISP